MDQKSGSLCPNLRCQNLADSRAYRQLHADLHSQRHAVLVLGCLCYWQGSKSEPKQQMPSETSETDGPVREVPKVVLPSVNPSMQARNAASTEPAEDQASLVQRLHTLEVTNPQLAVTLALEDRQRFPDRPDAEERDMILVTALNNSRDVLRARDQAWYYFMHYPQGQYTDYISKLSGISPPTTRPVH